MDQGWTPAGGRNGSWRHAQGDKYVPGDEARQLFGPDTETRRLYVVDARNHGFRGGQAEMLRDLDDALAWIENRASANQVPARD